MSTVKRQLQIKVCPLKWIHDFISDPFSIKNLGEFKFILSVRYYRDRSIKTIYLEQEQHISRILDKFDITKEKHKAREIPVAYYEHL